MKTGFPFDKLFNSIIDSRCRISKRRDLSILVAKKLKEKYDREKDWNRRLEREVKVSKRVMQDYPPRGVTMPAVVPGVEQLPRQRKRHKRTSSKGSSTGSFEQPVFVQLDAPVDDHTAEHEASPVYKKPRHFGEFLEHKRQAASIARSEPDPQGGEPSPPRKKSRVGAKSSPPVMRTVSDMSTAASTVYRSESLQSHRPKISIWDANQDEEPASSSTTVRLRPSNPIVNDDAPWWVRNQVDKDYYQHGGSWKASRATEYAATHMVWYMNPMMSIFVQFLCAGVNLEANVKPTWDELLPGYCSRCSGELQWMKRGKQWMVRCYNSCGQPGCDRDPIRIAPPQCPRCDSVMEWPKSRSQHLISCRSGKCVWQSYNKRGCHVFDTQVEPSDSAEYEVPFEEEIVMVPITEESHTSESTPASASTSLSDTMTSSEQGMSILRPVWNILTELGNVNLDYQYDTTHFGSFRVSCQWIPPRPWLCLVVLISLFMSFLLTGCNVEGNVSVSTLDPQTTFLDGDTSWFDFVELCDAFDSDFNAEEESFLSTREGNDEQQFENVLNANEQNEEEFNCAVVMGANVLLNRKSENVCIDGLELEHANDAHRHFDSRCKVCCESAMRHNAHKRKRTVRVGSVAIDLVSLGHGFDSCIIGVTKTDDGIRRIICYKVESKERAQLEAGIAKIILQAEQYWSIPIVKRVHCDRESGVAACNDFLAARAVRLTLTQGADPQANGEAENAVGEVCRGARASLNHLPDRSVRRRLWAHAVVHRGFVVSQKAGGMDGTKASEYLTRPIAPFGCRVIAKPTEANNRKCDELTVNGIYLYPDVMTPNAHVIAVLDDHLFIDRIASFVTFRFIKQEEKFCFPIVGIHLTAQDRKWIGVCSIKCTECNKVRWIQAKDQKTFEKRKFNCSQLRGLTCENPEGEVGVPCNIRRGRPNKAVPENVVNWAEEERNEVMVEMNAADDGEKVPETIEQEVRNAACDGTFLRATYVEDYCVFVARACTKEERTSSLADEARSTETSRILGYGSFDMPIERDDARKLYSDATVSYAAMLTYIKNAEKTDGTMKYKGRFVCLGDKVWSLVGWIQKVTAASQLWSPTAGLASSRLVYCWGLLNGYEVQSVDVEAAYLQCKWPDDLPKHFLILPDEMIVHMSDEQKNAAKGMKHPMFEMKTCIYGHERSGKVFVEALIGLLVEHGFQRSDADPALLRRGRTLVACYVDDCVASGPALELACLWALIRERFTVGTFGPAERFLGMDIDLDIVEDMIRKTFIHMSDYTLNACKEFAEMFNVKMYNVETPAVHDVKREDKDAAVKSKTVIRMVQKALGTALWICRCCRPDIAYVVIAMASRVCSWSELCDSQLVRLFRYLYSTAHYGIEMCCPVDADPMSSSIVLQVDSNFSKPKSQSCYIVMLVTKCGGRMLFNFGSSGQPIAADSSSIAEMIALHKGVKETLPYLGFLPGCSDVLDTREDNTATESAAIKGYSKGMAAYARAIGVRAQLIRDLQDRGMLKVSRIKSCDNGSDIGTKVLDRMTLQHCMELIGIRERKSSDVLEVTDGSTDLVNNTSIDDLKSDLVPCADSQPRNTNGVSANTVHQNASLYDELLSLVFVDEEDELLFPSLVRQRNGNFGEEATKEEGRQEC